MCIRDRDCANASVYDGGTALFEAFMMAVRATRRKKLVVDQCINPIWRAMLETYSSSMDITLVTVPHKDGLSDMEGLKAAVDATCAAVDVYKRQPRPWASAPGRSSWPCRRPTARAKSPPSTRPPTTTRSSWKCAKTSSATPTP